MIERPAGILVKLPEKRLLSMGKEHDTMKRERRGRRSRVFVDISVLILYLIMTLHLLYI
jgi:hypothetical protein